MNVRSYLMAFSDIDVQETESIRPFADEYRKLYIKTYGKEPPTDGAGRGDALYHPLFLQFNYEEVTNNLRSRLFKQVFPHTRDS